jgi:hypothetical protein
MPSTSLRYNPAIGRFSDGNSKPPEKRETKQGFNFRKAQPDQLNYRKRSVPLFEKEGLGEIF